ncbi:hypothetical protein MMC14_003464 [Varicellaria rhodocarpa]|nr:hypothetical protein [Varicellaria rhodocarpa]
MDALVTTTLEFGMVPPIVVEFPGITVGGGFSGTSGESSSFRHGFFDRIVASVEVVVGDGRIVNASSFENQDLFHGTAASFGMLGVITLLEIQLVQAKTYVELTYHPIHSVQEALRKIEQVTEDESTDFLDGILFAQDKGVICSGRLTNQASPAYKIRCFTRATDPWFYIHARRLLAAYPNESITELVPLVDYFFRYDRGVFWIGTYAFRYFITSFNRITRWVLDYFMHTRILYRALHQSGHSKRYILQDIAVPYLGAEELSEYLDKTFGHYPLWLCPIQQSGETPDSPYGLMAQKKGPGDPDMLLNFGVWGPGPTGQDEFVAVNRALEQKVHDLRGKKWLYAHTYYTEREFWDAYGGQKEYDALRSKYNASYLPTIYEKVRVDIESENGVSTSLIPWLLSIFWSIWPLSGLYGVYKVVLGGDYLLGREISRKRPVPREKFKE